MRLDLAKQKLSLMYARTGASRMNLFRGRVRPIHNPETEPAASQDMRWYAIGDLHGRRDLLQTMSQLVAADLRANPPQDAMTVFLGDYIDRGPDSAGVIEQLAEANFPTPLVALRGNHEATMLDFLQDETVLGSWRHYGGLETLLSYGVDVREALRGRDFGTAQQALRDRLPASHLRFLQETKFFHAAADYYFCHAGVRPLVPLARQAEHDLMWIRDEFRSHRDPFEKIIVHGHTPVEQPEDLPNRINVDTGAYATGRLTCVALDGMRRRFIST
jgi:serine/threonine protein phosphatase 1